MKFDQGVIIIELLSRLFGCWHRHCSFPITLRVRPQSSFPTRTYIVCLDCGKQLPYDWNEMKLLKPSTERHRPAREFIARHSA